MRSRGDGKVGLIRKALEDIGIPKLSRWINLVSDGSSRAKRSSVRARKQASEKKRANCQTRFLEDIHLRSRFACDPYEGKATIYRLKQIATGE